MTRRAAARWNASPGEAPRGAVKATVDWMLGQIK
jgi:hypothetical protein